VNTPSDARYPLRSRIRILVIEDSVEDYGLLVATLGRQGLNVDCSRIDDQESMIAALAEAPWDAVISDHLLARFSSTEALRVLREGGRSLPFLIVSGSIDEDIAVQAMREGADDYLFKGRLERLGPALVNAMRGAEARRERLRAEHAMRESERRLRELSAHLQHVVEEERSAIAREIHDEIGGTLTALRFDLGWIARNGEGAVRQRAEQALEALGVAQQSSQRLVRDLRPPVLDAGIIAALDWQLGQFRKRTGAQTTLRVNTDRIEIGDAAAMTVYRTLQEALTNVVKHANGSRVDVDVVVRDGVFSLEVHDDGRGIAPGDLEKATSFGLRGLAERAHAVGGWLEVSPGRRGTALLLTVPVSDSAQTAPAAAAGERST
jgi:signal transduction histidine kinase